MPNQRYNAVITPDAEQHWLNHFEFLANFNIALAERTEKEFEESITLIEDNPCMFRRFESKIIDKEFRRKVFGKYYRIVYEVVDYDVIIRDVQDCRQDTDKNFT
jgi:plasmid stabilization system protein ParE